MPGRARPRPRPALGSRPGFGALLRSEERPFVSRDTRVEQTRGFARNVVSRVGCCRGRAVACAVVGAGRVEVGARWNAARVVLG